MVFDMNLFVLSFNEDLALQRQLVCSYILLGAKVEMHRSFVENHVKLTNTQTCEQTPTQGTRNSERLFTQVCQGVRRLFYVVSRFRFL